MPEGEFAVLRYLFHPFGTTAHLGTTLEISLVVNTMEDTAQEYNRNTWGRRTSRHDRRKIHLSTHTHRALGNKF